MSHGDRVLRLPAGLRGARARATNSPFAAVRHATRPIYGVQFHPEVAHTAGGHADPRATSRTASAAARATGRWTRSSTRRSRAIRAQVGERRAVCGLSGGVDSSVAAALVHRAIGDRLTCIFVDNGLLREGERAEVERMFREHLEHAARHRRRRATRFLERARAASTTPRRSAASSASTFIEVFEEEAREARRRVDFLVQGTLYPDVIESVSVHGPSATIKTHHNVGGLPERMHLALVEPLRELFKDEVREVGRQLGLPEALVGRHPFPGPGLAIRVLGEVTRERLAIAARAPTRSCSRRSARRASTTQLWQAFAVLLPGAERRRDGRRAHLRQRRSRCARDRRRTR